MAHNLIGEGGATGALAQWSDLVRQQAGRFFGASGKRSTGAYRGFADLIPQEWAFFDSWQGKLEYVLIEGENALGHSKNFVDQEVIQPYLGLPVATAQGEPVPLSAKPARFCTPDQPVTGTTPCRGWRDQELMRVGADFPENGVIDLKTGLMWSQSVWNYNYSVPTTAPKGGKAWADRVVQDYFNNPQYSDLSGGYSNWRLPTEAELKSLFDGNTTPPGLRARLTDEGGFFQNPPNQTSRQPLDRLSNDALVWTSTQAGNQFGMGYLPTGTFQNGTGPANVIVVRNLGPCEHYYYDLSKPLPPLC
jgi:hypothetical protein